MLTVNTSHYPAPDDISFDALEYLFCPTGKTAEPPIPWVQMEDDVPEYARRQVLKLEAELALVERELRENAANVKRACVLIGYLQAMLQQKDEQLKTLPDLRFRAAESIAYKVDAERCRAKIVELEELISRQENSNSKRSMFNSDGIVKFLFTPVPAENTTSLILNCLAIAVLSVVVICLLCGMY